MSLDCLTAQTCALATDRNLESDSVMIRPSSTAQEKVPFSHTSEHGSGACCHDYGNQGISMGTVVCRWNLMEQLETQVGQQRAVIEHQQEQLMRQQMTIDAERAIAHDVRGNLVDLRVGNKPETFAGETHEWRLVIQDASVHRGERDSLRSC